MFNLTVLLFILVPLAELYVLIEVGGVIGALPTILLTVFTAVVGVALMRQQGVSTMQRAQASMAQGQPPAQEMMEGVLLFLGGLFLLIPGLMTDFLGFLLLIPPLRAVMARKVIEQRRTQYAQQRDGVFETEWTQKSEDGDQILHVRTLGRSEGRSGHDERVIDGEVTHESSDQSDASKDDRGRNR
ncbi:FxsA family protein [Thiomicrospira sp. WB1]|uniref:FxsA family protein n=1 Tax=Thiomicrospira sp. WB1 TaxID=1685380 RepID=UPI000748C7F5|nr:FxsA family protein [Thiomicrospira sp. WB1]KUJ72711.1 FxsA protein [Thiomicrospira sp. WB1]